MSPLLVLHINISGTGSILGGGGGGGGEGGGCNPRNPTPDIFLAIGSIWLFVMCYICIVASVYWLRDVSAQAMNPLWTL